MARRSAAQAAQTRRDILAAGARVFSRSGIAGTSLEAVPREAGVTRGAIYWHFEGKRGLLAALLSEQQLPIEQGLPADLTFATGWAFLGEALTQTLNDDMSRQLSKIMLHKSERIAGDSLVAARLEQIRSGFVERLRLLLQVAVARGELDARLDIDRASDMCRTSVSGLLFECLQAANSNPGQACAMLETLRYLLLNPPTHWLRPPGAPASGA